MCTQYIREDGTIDLDNVKLPLTLSQKDDLESVIAKAFLNNRLSFATKPVFARLEGGVLTFVGTAWMDAERSSVTLKGEISVTDRTVLAEDLNWMCFDTLYITQQEDGNVSQM